MLRVAYIAPGAGDLYCGACASDLALVRALRRQHVSTLMVPLYTPLRDGEDVIGRQHVFLGGVSTWLRASAKPLSWLATPLRPLLDSQRVLRLASRFAIRTDPHALGPLTLSVLRGESGPHNREVARILQYLKTDARPQVVHLSNSMLSSLARPLKRELGCPIVCSVQGEEHFISLLPTPYQGFAVRLLRENLRYVDEIVRPTRTGAAVAAEMTGRDPAGFHIIPPALEIPPLPAPLRNTPYTVIGYLSALRPEKGLDLLISALEDVAPRLRCPVELRIAGQVVDARWWNRQYARLESLMPGVAPRFLGEITPAQKAAMMTECHLFVMPSRVPEVRALAALEAMAGGCALVAPRHGVFEEYLADSPEMLFSPGDFHMLGDILFRLLRDPDQIESAGAKAAAVAARYSADAAGAKLASLYSSLCPQTSSIGEPDAARPE